MLGSFHEIPSPVTDRQNTTESRKEKKEKSKRKERKKNSARFSHEIESLSGMWGHVCRVLGVCGVSSQP